MTSTMTRFQKLTSDPSQTKFLILNPSSFPSNKSSTPPAQNGENVFLEEALRECENEKVELRNENVEWRTFVGELEEWVERIGEVEGVLIRNSDALVMGIDDADEGDQVNYLPLLFFSPHN